MKTEIKEADECRMNVFLDNLFLYGRMNLSYTLLQGLGLYNALVLSELICELVVAYKCELFYEDKFFIFSNTNLSVAFGINVNLIDNVIKSLVNLELVKTKMSSDDKFMLIEVQESNLLEFVRNLDNRRDKKLDPNYYEKIYDCLCQGVVKERINGGQNVSA